MEPNKRAVSSSFVICTQVVLATAVIWFGSLGTPAHAQLTDFGDAPDNTVNPTLEAYPGVAGRFPSLLNTTNAVVPGNTGAHHDLTGTGEWLHPVQPSGIVLAPVTGESDAKLVDQDEDGAVVQIFCEVPPPPPGFPPALWQYFLQINAIGVNEVAPDTLRFVNALVDVNRNGRWDSADPFGTFPREHVIVDKAMRVPLLSAQILMSGPFVLQDIAPVWVRVTVTRAPLGIEGWDGSVPPWGFPSGETEDHLVMPLEFPFAQLSKEPPTNFTLTVVPNPVRVPESGAQFGVRVTRRRGPGGFKRADTVILTIGGCQTVIFPPAQQGITIGGGIVNDQGSVQTGKLPIGIGTGAFVEVLFQAQYPSPKDKRKTTCRVSLKVDPDGEIMEYDYPFNAELPIRFMELAVPDADQDGVSDDSDQCPWEVEDLDGFQDDDGCPDPDNDQDGVLDVEDICPLDIDNLAFDGCPHPLSTFFST